MDQATHLIRMDCPHEEATERLGEIIAELVDRPVCIALEGELGAGKTRLARGLARGLGLDPNVISSPTFVIHVEHLGEGEGSACLSHLDAYRTRGVEELESIGFDELLEDPRRLVAIEWASRIGDALPESRIEIRLDHRDPQTRAATVLDLRNDPRARLRLREALEARAGAWSTTLGGEKTCPTCGKTCEDAEARPFCSSRCRLVDLQAWFGDEYAISRPLDATDFLED
ncbi:MAG: tRNA (adenosine(37)-N6)-threonylcarbamoyltransferase complex ATPase subunit type 1 TsaE [Phycisphaerae bacterium]|nr:tRNA (adenosine(37)-N6)-threonylcarbamoyltransferase complex ATPase subunit type 1 TsaE [Phycisphaerae bacterium]